MRKLNKIFIIEDDLNILYGMKDIFISSDFKVDFSDSKEDIEEIINKIKKFNPNSVIMDMVLPEIDGQELIKTIKSEPSLGDVEIFIFTDLSDEDGRARSVDLGANYYFMKNEFDIHSFSNKVIRIMSGDSVSSDDQKDEDDLDNLLVMN